jgi:hypothetical protein
MVVLPPIRVDVAGSSFSVPRFRQRSDRDRQVLEVPELSADVQQAVAGFPELPGKSRRKIS